MNARLVLAGVLGLFVSASSGYLYTPPPAALPPSGAAGGSLSGTYPNPALASQADSTLLGNGSGSAAASGPISFAANTFPARSSTGSLAAKAITDFGLSLVDDSNATAAQTTLALVPGTNVEAYDADLACIAGLTSGADKVPYFTGVGTCAVGTFTSAGRALVDDADAATQRTTLGGTTVGQALFTLANPSAIRFLQVNADNTVTAQSAGSQLTALSGVAGPGSSTSGDIATFNGTGGLTIQDSGKSHSTDGTLASNSDALVPTQKAVKTYVDAEASARATAVTNKPEAFIIACSDETTALAAGTAKITWRMPYAFTVTAVRISLSTAQTSGNIYTVDVNEAGTTILSTKATIDNTESTSTTAATPLVISDSSLADDAQMSIDIDQIGDGTAKGCKVTLIGHQ